MPVDFDPRWDAPDFDPDTLCPAERRKFDAFWREEMRRMAADADADADADGVGL